MSGMSDRTELPRSKPCPICGKPSAPEFRPFCTRRCADVDLHRWLSESYRIPGEDRPGAGGDGKNQSESED